MSYVLVKTGNGYDSSKYREFMVKAESDLADISKEDAAPGSVAYTEDLSSIWIMGVDGEWVSAS